MPWSWSEPYWFCDQLWTQVVQSPAQAGWPYGPGPRSTGTGYVRAVQLQHCSLQRDPFLWDAADSMAASSCGGRNGCLHMHFLLSPRQ